MKKILKLTALLFVAVTVLVGCDKFEYTMVECKTRDFVYFVPDHFDYSISEDAEDFYLTRNSNIAVYAYNHAEFDAVFTDYSGDYSAMDVAEYIVEKREDNANVYEGVENSAQYSFIYTDGENSFYSITTVNTDAESVYVLVFSCVLDKLDLYQDMIFEILDSARIVEGE